MTTVIFTILVIVVFIPIALTVYLVQTHNRNKPVIKDYQSPKRPCKASWQVKVYGGNLYEVKCRKCGVRVESNGTPKCQNLWK